MGGSPAEGWEDELERWLEPFLAATAAQGAAPLGAVLPQGPDPARRAQERGADGGAGGAGRHPAAAPLRLDLALGHGTPGGRAGQGRRPAGGRAGRGAGGGRHRAGEAGPALGRGEAAVLRPARQAGQLPGAGLADPGPGRGAGRASACGCSCPRTGAPTPGGARPRACPRPSATGRSGGSRWTRSTASWPPAPGSAACWPTPSTARRPSSATASSERRLLCAVGILPTQKVYPADVTLAYPARKPTGRPRKHPVPSAASVAAAELIEAPAGGVPHHLVADRHQGPAPGRVRRAAGAGGRRAGRRAGPAPAGRGGVARRRAPRHRRAKVLPGEPPGRHAARGPGGADQGALGLRADAPAAQGRAGAGPLRGPELARAAPPRALVPARLRLPPAPAARGKKRRRPRPSPDRRPGRACRRSGGASWPRSPASCCAARTAGSASTITSGSERGRVVLVV